MPVHDDGDREALDAVMRAMAEDARAESGAPFVELVAEYFARAGAGEGGVSTARSPDEIRERVRMPLPEGGHSLGTLVARLRRDVVAESNRLYHPKAIGHQVAPPLPAAVWTEPVIAALNQSVAVWEMSPVATVIEAEVVRWMTELAGLGPQAGGTFTSGGTEATFTALLAARAAALPTAWRDGVGADPPVIVCGEHAHYATARAAGELGLGTRRLVVVPSRGYRMDPAALARTLDELAAAGTRVLAVVATAGSTATGSFDDLSAIADTCDAHGAWLHVDAAHGGSALLSAAHRARLRGIERARSIAWDPHKMMLMPLAAGVLLVRDERDLGAAFAQAAPYLFGRGADERAWNHGERSFQCSRRADAIKVWVALQRYGVRGLGALYDRLCATTRALHEAIAARTDFEALHEPESNILCFRHVGHRRAGDAEPEPAASDARLLDLRTRYNRSGRGWITTTMLDGRRVLRVTIMNPRTSDADVRAMLDEVAGMG